MINVSHHRKTRRRSSSWLLIGLFLLLALPLAAQQKKDGAKEGAKQLFYNPTTGAASQPGEKERSKQGQPSGLARKAQRSLIPGIHYWIELEGVGRVTDDYVFHTGERIKLHMRSNVDGYLSLWAYDPSGESQLLFPAPEQPEDNRVRANSEYTVPGTIEFKPPAEDERLMIFFSQSSDEAPQPRTGRLTAQQARQATEPEGDKVLLFEVEKKDKEKTGTYVVNRQGGAIAKEIRLKHRSPGQSK